jgi:hypothetical protein
VGERVNFFKINARSVHPAPTHMLPKKPNLVIEPVVVFRSQQELSRNTSEISIDSGNLIVVSLLR